MNAPFKKMDIGYMHCAPMHTASGGIRTPNEIPGSKPASISASAGCREWSTSEEATDNDVQTYFAPDPPTQEIKNLHSAESRLVNAML